MFNPFKFKRNKPSEMPPWLKWGLLIFLCIIFFVNSQSEEGKPSRIQTAVDNIKEQLPQKDLYTKHLPQTVEQTSVSQEIITPGTGHPLLCGQTALLDYASYNEKANITSGTVELTNIPSKDNEQLTSLITGMNIGETRRITLDKSAPITQWIVSDNSDPITHFDLTLTKATSDASALFDDKNIGIKLFDETIGTGESASCGGEVSVTYQLFSSDGQATQRATTSFTIGTGQVIAGLEQGVIGMQSGGKRIMILPSAWQQHLYDHPNPDKKLATKNNNQLMILEVVREE